MADVSIIICTRNRAEDLRKTLDSFKNVRVPAELTCELIVVDNDSDDQTADIIHGCALSTMPVRYVYESRRGQNHGYNTAMAVAMGDIFLFTDDDVRPPNNWIEAMCEPITSGRAHLVAGGVKLAPYLERPWLEPLHRMWMASTDYIDGDNPQEVIGANMAFSRAVLSKISGFDPELGPGALGYGGDTLFAEQALKGGFVIEARRDTVAEHHADESRLLRNHLLRSAEAHGETWAYCAYHWRHEDPPSPRFRMLKSLVRLALWRLRHPRSKRTEGLQSKEAIYVADVAFYRRFLHERKRPRNYSKFGLVKLRGVLCESKLAPPGAGSCPRVVTGAADAAAATRQVVPGRS